VGNVSIDVKTVGGSVEPVVQSVGFFASLDHNLTNLLASYGHQIYDILFLVVFLETGLVIFPFLPGDSLLFAAGTLAASGQAEIIHVCVTLFLAAIAGNNSNYWIGRWFGKRVFKWEDSRFFNRKLFNKTHAYYGKHGGKTIILARFIPFARTFAPFVAGAVQMDYRHFLAMDMIGASSWVLSLTFGGYWFGRLPIIRDNLGIIVFGLLCLSLIPIALAIWKGRELTRE
jgi:membrane-associated protein